MQQKPQRITKFLARVGVASRREIERMILAGRISVNNQPLKTVAIFVNENDYIQIDAKPIPPKQPTKMWKYHKPRGLVNTTRDEKNRKTIFDSLPNNLPRVMTIGRLDINSEGLLLLTNNGALKRNLELPTNKWIRHYRARVHGHIKRQNLNKLRNGITLGNEHLRPMQIIFERQQGSNAWLFIAITEGKYREIRRAFKAIDLTVNRLIRTRYGPFCLNNLAKNQTQSISTATLKKYRLL